MKSNHIGIFLPDLRGGGAEKVTVNLANKLIERGYIVDLILVSKSGPFLQLLNPKINIIDFDSKRMRWSLFYFIKYLNSNRPEIVLACMWPLSIIAIIARLFVRTKTQILVAEHITWSSSQVEYSPFSRLFIKLTMRFFFPLAKEIIAVSDGAANDLSSFANVERKKISTIYNPIVEVKNLYFSNSNLIKFENWKNAELRVLTVGNLKEQKNHELLINSFALLRKRINAHLLILGEGHLRSRLENQINRLNLEGYVLLPGFVDDPRPYYQHANLFVLSSDWEGLPTVLVEAMAAGTPVVSTDCPSGPREIMCDGMYGKLIPMGDPVILANAMYNSLRTKHNSQALRSRASDFSIDNSVDRYEFLFHR